MYVAVTHAEPPAGLSCHDLPNIGPKALTKLKHASSFYVFVSIDYQLQWTSVVKKSNDTKWEDKLYL
jgi:hypothetical protein